MTRKNKTKVSANKSKVNTVTTKQIFIQTLIKIIYLKINKQSFNVHCSFMTKRAKIYSKKYFFPCTEGNGIIKIPFKKNA